MSPPNTVLNRISSAKNELLVPSEYAKAATDPVGKVASRVYARYQERLKASNAMDFDDLLVYTYLLLKHHPDILAAYHDRFHYIMVDEYQDTDHARCCTITKLLAAARKNIMVVGDDDQSIYSWRGADISNILDFEEDYPDARVVKLEQNYRSTANILNAANAVIANNRKRKDKRLFTEVGSGDKVGVFVASDERDEGRWVAGEIEKLKSDGASYNQMAVFYRTNAQSRVIEDMLGIRVGVPYRIVGGTKFFDRKEIRDVMAYLSLVVNPADDVSFERVVNTPKRGIGKGTIEQMEEVARTFHMPMLEAAETLVADETVRPSARKSIGEFVEMVKTAGTYEGDLRKVVERIIDDWGMIEAGRGPRGHRRGPTAALENIKAAPARWGDGVRRDARRTRRGRADDEGTPPRPTTRGRRPTQGNCWRLLADDSEEEPARTLRGDSLADFIELGPAAHRFGRRRRRRGRRHSDDGAFGQGAGIRLRVRHRHGGERVFPHMNSIGESEGVEEERRLAYVAITRARKKLCLTCAQTRQLFGQTNANPASRFIQEIPFRAPRHEGARLGRVRREAAGRSGGAGAAYREAAAKPGAEACRTSCPRRRERAGEGPCRASRQGRTASGPADHLQEGRHRRPQDVRQGRRHQGGRRHVAGEVREDRPGQEAVEGLRAYRQAVIGYSMQVDNNPEGD